MNILDQLAAHARTRVAADREQIPLEAMRELAERLKNEGNNPFEDALRKPGLSFICEIKQASPSKGLISPEFPYVRIARDYEEAGADCVSCLTEPKWFLGSDDIFREIRGAISTPMLRKDFTVDEYQIYQAKALGADAVLLICAILDTGTVHRYLELCSNLSLAALVETHNEQEIISAVTAGARIIGVNNRNLKDFTVDLSNAARLRDMIPPECLFVAESGITTPNDAAAMHAIGADGVLIGETLMRSADRTGLLRAMREASK